MTTAIQRICVYCGSSAGHNPAYIAAARVLAKAMVARNIQLVYGGAGIGIMGSLADQVLAYGGQVIGVIPQGLALKEVLHTNLTELHITQSMHERKMLMAELADGFIALPGGIGTLEELFEIWTWAQLGIHQKPCGLLNVAGYYDALLQFLTQILTEGFVKPATHQLLLVETEADVLLERMLSYVAPSMHTVWLDKHQL
jgi:uncharacterized protein (TIGR00730 family)